MKTIIEEPSSTENLNKEVIHSLFTCYFVNIPHLLNGWSIPLPFVGNPYFVNKLRLYKPRIRIMLDNFSGLS